MEKKHPNVPIKDYITRKMTVELGIPEKIIKLIIDDAFTNAIKATKIYKSVEISGWGTFYFNDSRAKKLLEKFKSQIALFTDWLENKELSPTKRKNAEAKLLAAQNNFNILQPRINE